MEEVEGWREEEFFDFRIASESTEVWVSKEKEGVEEEVERREEEEDVLFLDIASFKEKEGVEEEVERLREEEEVVRCLGVDSTRAVATEPPI